MAAIVKEEEKGGGRGEEGDKKGKGGERAQAVTTESNSSDSVF